MGYEKQANAPEPTEPNSGLGKVVLADPHLKALSNEELQAQIEPETASLLLRAVQTAKSTLKPKASARKHRPKSVRDQGKKEWGDAAGRSA